MMAVALWSCVPVALWPHSAPVLANARPGASLGHDFMTLRAISWLLWPYGPMLLCFYGSTALAIQGSCHIRQWPYKALAISGTCHVRHLPCKAILVSLSLLCPPTLPLGEEFQPNSNQIPTKFQPNSNRIPTEFQPIFRNFSLLLTNPAPWRLST